MSTPKMLLLAAHTSTGVAQRRGRGQIIVMFALCVTAFLVLLGGSLDLAAVLMERGRLQNAVDSAALAAAQTLGDNGTQTTATASANNFLTLNGYPAGSNGNTVQVTYPPTDPNSPQGATQIVDVSLGHPYQTSFWSLVGLRTVNLQVDAQASSPARRFDIFLSVDETSSMKDDDISQLRRAAHLFIQTLNPTPDDPYSPKVAMSDFEGLRYGAAYTVNGQYTEVALRESLILSHLTNTALNLYTLIDGLQGGAGCGSLSLPSGLNNQPPMPYAAYPPQAEQNQYPLGVELWQLTDAPRYNPEPPVLSDFACPLKSDHRGVNRTFIGDGITAAFTRGVVSPTGASTFWDAFDHTHGGRDGHKPDGSTDPGLPAKRVLVMMTDGTSNIMPLSPGGPGDCARPTPYCTPGILREEIGTSDDQATGVFEDQAAVEAANVAKSGPDGQPGTADDIEIYTIGFFGDNESNFTNGPKPLCPAASMPSGGSRADQVLRDMSSSTGSNSCDHYFPLAKVYGQQNDQGLPTIFSSIAGRIKRAQLAN